MFSKSKESSKGPTSVDIRQPGPCRQELTISVTADGVTPVREVVVKEFQREANIAGFRKGKAPRQMVESKYPSEIREETVRRLTRQVFEQVTEERKLKPVGPFEVTKLEFDDAKGLALEARVEVEPEFELAAYKDIRVTPPEIVVAPDDVEQALKQVQESMAELVEVEAGKPKERRVPAVDDELAKDAGFESLAKLREHLEAKIREQKRGRQHAELEQQVCDLLLARHTFDVPAGLVTKQTERLTRDFQVRLLMSGMNEEQAKVELEKYTEQLRTNAVRVVKLSFILDRVADAEHLDVTQDELVDRLWKLSRRWGRDPAEVRKMLDSQGLWPSVISSIRQDKTVAFLLNLAVPQSESVEQASAGSAK